MDCSVTELRAFATVARYRSFRAAADALGVTRSSLSHAVRGLESDLGVRLLHRTTRSVAPTEAGRRLLDRLAPALADLDDMLAEVRGGGGEVRGSLRINALERAVRWLVRHVVPDFLARYPHVMLDLVSDDRFVDIVAEGFDAGVRLREAVPQDMIAVPFGGPIRFLAVASPDYVAIHGEPGVPDDLKRHRCIRQRLASGKPYRWEFVNGHDDVRIEVDGALTLDSNAVMVEAAVAGLGIAFVPEPVAKEAIDAGRLIPLLQPWSPPVAGFNLYYPGHRHIPAPLRAFTEAIRLARPNGT